MKLTDKAVAALSLRAGERERTESDDSTTGLYIRLRAGANGASKRWLFRYSRGGRQHKFTLDYPAFNLAAARKQVGELQAVYCHPRINPIGPAQNGARTVQQLTINLVESKSERLIDVPRIEPSS